VSIEINSTSLAFFGYDGHEVHIKYASTPNMRTIVTKFRNKNCSLSKHLNDMKRIKSVTLTFLSPCEVKMVQNFVYATVNYWVNSCSNQFSYFFFAGARFHYVREEILCIKVYQLVYFAILE
jgi:hypothetical protein